jgi:hypothetical protein
LKINAHPHPRDAVKGLLKTIKSDEYQVRRANYEDRGVGTLADGYTSTDQIANVVKHYYAKNQFYGEQLRNALAFLFAHYFLLRGESIRKMELPDLQCIVEEIACSVGLLLHSVFLVCGRSGSICSTESATRVSVVLVVVRLAMMFLLVS